MEKDELETLIASTSGSNALAIAEFKNPNATINLSKITDYNLKKCFIHAMKDGLLDLEALGGEFCFMLSAKGDKMWGLIHSPIHASSVKGGVHSAEARR